MFVLKLGGIRTYLNLKVKHFVHKKIQLLSHRSLKKTYFALSLIFMFGCRFMARYPEFPKPHDRIEICLGVVAKELGTKKRNNSFAEISRTEENALNMVKRTKVPKPTPKSHI